jgi:cell division protein ZapA
MADVRLSIAGREYIVTCKDGEEHRLNALGNLVDLKAREAGGAAGGLNESRQLLFASLLLADQLYDAQPSNGAGTITSDLLRENANQMAEIIERLADRLETLAQGLEQRGQAT